MDSQGPSLARLGCIMFSIFIITQTDLENPTNLLCYRFIFFFVQTSILVLCAYIFFRMSRNNKNNNNNTKITVPPETSFFSHLIPDSGKPTRMTVSEYDRMELFALIRKTVITMCIISIIHFKFGIVPPLIVSSVLALFSLYSSPLIKIYLFGSDITRPWKKESQNPFASFMPKDAQTKSKSGQKSKRSLQDSNGEPKEGEDTNKDISQLQQDKKLQSRNRKK
jgi:hypothetical protein